MNQIRWVAGVPTAACVMALFLGAGPAVAAPDVVGKTYGEAKGILGQAGMSTVVVTVLGDRVEQDQCYVTSTTQMTPLDSSGDPAAYNQVQVNLNCYVGQSDKKTPGYSKGNNSPEAVATRATSAAAREKWLASDQGQKWCVDSEAAHPDWAPIEGCHSPEEAEAMQQKKWKASPEGQAWCAQAEAEHPEWAPIADCHLEQPLAATSAAA
jgi:hypothetical protein